MKKGKASKYNRTSTTSYVDGTLLWKYSVPSDVTAVFNIFWRNGEAKPMATLR